MARSVAIIGAGQIAFALWAALDPDEWECRVHSRSFPNWLEPSPDKYRPYQRGMDPCPAAELVIDTIAFDAEDVAEYDPEKIGRLITISSASVYCDAQGRTLDEAAQNGFPKFGGPILESQSTVLPGPGTYSTRKIRMEEASFATFGERATVLRPCAVYGTFSRHPREWWFVKRMVDGRQKIPLALRGASRFQTTAASWIAEVVCAAAERNAGGVYNVADAGAYNVLEIGKSIAQELKVSPEFVLIDDYPTDAVGRTPWSVPAPFVVKSEKIKALIGYHGPDYSTRMCSMVD